MVGGGRASGRNGARAATRSHTDPDQLQLRVVEAARVVVAHRIAVGAVRQLWSCRSPSAGRRRRTCRARRRSHGRRSTQVRAPSRRSTRPLSPARVSITLLRQLAPCGSARRGADATSDRTSYQDSGRPMGRAQLTVDVTHQRGMRAQQALSRPLASVRREQFLATDTRDNACASCNLRVVQANRFRTCRSRTRSVAAGAAQACAGCGVWRAMMRSASTPAGSVPNARPQSPPGGRRRTRPRPPGRRRAPAARPGGRAPCARRSCGRVPRCPRSRTGRPSASRTDSATAGSAGAVSSISSKKTCSDSGLLTIARSTSRQITLPDPSQIEFSGASRYSRGMPDSST